MHRVASDLAHRNRQYLVARLQHTYISFILSVGHTKLSVGRKKMRELHSRRHDSILASAGIYVCFSYKVTYSSEHPANVLHKDIEFAPRHDSFKC